MCVSLFVFTLSAFVHSGRAGRQFSDTVPGVRESRGRFDQRDGRRLTLRQSRAQYQEQSGERLMSTSESDRWRVSYDSLDGSTCGQM